MIPTPYGGSGALKVAVAAACMEGAQLYQREIVGRDALNRLSWSAKLSDGRLGASQAHVRPE